MKGNYYIVSVVIFGGLAVSFLLDLWGSTPVVVQNPPVDPSFVSTETVRDPQLGPLSLRKIGFDYPCAECHQLFDLEDDQREPIGEHTTIKLEHGENNRCANCHHLGNIEKLIAHDGGEIDPARSDQLCMKCHGPKHRDWAAGVHGRQNGYWDMNLGETKAVSCVACHDPHAPAFGSLHPAPAPREEISAKHGATHEAPETPEGSSTHESE